jgi:putative DNA primase/helicase
MPIKLVKKSKPQTDDGTAVAHASPHNEGLPGEVIEFPATKPAVSVSLTEDDVAEYFVKQFGDVLRFDCHRGAWFVWNDIRWVLDEKGIVFHHARLLCRELRGDKKTMSSKKCAAAVEGMARSDPRLAVTSDLWNRDTFLVGTPGGTVNLKTGDLCQPKSTDFINRLTTVQPAPKGSPCPTFDQFLTEATGNDKNLIRFLQQWAGYCLTGDTREEALIFIYGPGGNGKSVFLSVLTEVLGDYAKTAAMETFTASKYPRHLTELAMLHGSRIVTASETDKGHEWSETRIKQVTGNDPITANYMRQDHFTYRPQFKLTLIGNEKPKLAGVNEATRRRFNIVEFTYKPTQPDKELRAKLREEYPAILRWMIDGCLDWYANGLVRPEAVLVATSEYFDAHDTFGHWIEEQCNCLPGKKTNASELFSAWKKYAVENGEEPGSTVSFAEKMENGGFKKKKINGLKFYLGIELKIDGNFQYLKEQV